MYGPKYENAYLFYIMNFILTITKANPYINKTGIRKILEGILGGPIEAMELGSLDFLLMLIPGVDENDESLYYFSPYRRLMEFDKSSSSHDMIEMWGFCYEFYYNIW
ncbi:hypothetical protein ABEB36_015456 [Hypothenemus hampei]|uniref:Uncharacterized protein n=1 Tax=Hypothenemus hampei TaxID=57062 RepID=A0ABD1E097_HYPHA